MEEHADSISKQAIFTRIQHTLEDLRDLRKYMTLYYDFTKNVSHDFDLGLQFDLYL